MALVLESGLLAGNEMMISSCSDQMTLPLATDRSEAESQGEQSNYEYAMDTVRGRSAERWAPRPRAQSVDTATALPSREQLVWQVERWREAALEAREQAAAIQEELMQFQEALLNHESQDGTTSASRYVARLSKENFRLGGELSRLEQLMYERQDVQGASHRNRSSSRDSQRTTTSSAWLSARSSPISTPRCKGAPLISPGTGLPLNLKQLNFKKVRPDLDDEDDEPAGSARLDTTRSGTSESTEVDSEVENDDVSNRSKQ
eukprot:gnl/MRDRNA2_/MRDRNA2_90814_c0_seq1.p1 gnl/MRDRNA2_/MRDRNA2_90814_c0~~gnl/MRDRNA2_/MRDRNA2_90814_c0_seq1.p1  ORF type:complete len:261 (-),score=51.80 gnl/MRDRNA2_/MRDRNA2_90814_c0_seq1:182-964(-)